MPQKFIRYRVKPEKISENRLLIEGVFRELQAKSPKDVRYLVLKLSDGTFCHLVQDVSKTIPSLDAFAAFRRGGQERRLEEPQQIDAEVVGNYRMLFMLSIGWRVVAGSSLARTVIQDARLAAISGASPSPRSRSSFPVCRGRPPAEAFPRGILTKSINRRNDLPRER